MMRPFRFFDMILVAACALTTCFTALLHPKHVLVSSIHKWASECQVLQMGACLDGKEDAGEVRIYDVVPLLRLHPHHQRVPRYACIDIIDYCLSLCF